LKAPCRRGVRYALLTSCPLTATDRYTPPPRSSAPSYFLPATASSCPLTFAPYRLLDALACVSRRQLAIANATHLHFQFKAINGDSGDEFYLVKA
jgi:hypothetical protein